MVATDVQVLEASIKAEAEIFAVEAELQKQQRELFVKAELRKIPLYKKRDETLQAIPEFWATALSNYYFVASVLKEDEAEALGFLKTFRVERNEANPLSFKLVFEFKENPFFEETLIEKEICHEDDEPIVKPVNFTWKSGKPLGLAVEKFVPRTEEEEEEHHHHGEESFFSLLQSDDACGWEFFEHLADEFYAGACSFFLGEAEEDDDEEDYEDIE